MQKLGRIMRITTALLLCLVIATTSILSSTYAKYTTTGTSGSDSARVAMWGIEITSGSELSTTHKNGNGEIVVSSSTTLGADNLLAPGTSGRLAWFHIKGTPEVAYNVNFTGNLSIGDGFFSTETLDSDDELLAQLFIFDEYGQQIDYFPIIIYCIAYDVSYDGNDEMILTKTTAKNINNGNMDTRNCLQRTDDAGVTHRYFDNDAWEDLSVMQSKLNDLDEASTKSLNRVFDSDNSAAVPIDRIYAVEWCWPYNNDSDYEGKDTASGTYQTRELDTKLGELIAQYPEMFKIILDMSVSVTQIN